MAVRTRTYPRPDTHAHAILSYIKENEGTTKNGIITGLQLNPGIVRKAVVALLEAGAIKDAPDQNQNHHYSAMDPL